MPLGGSTSGNLNRISVLHRTTRLLVRMRFFTLDSASLHFATIFLGFDPASLATRLTKQSDFFYEEPAALGATKLAFHWQRFTVVIRVKCVYYYGRRILFLAVATGALEPGSNMQLGTIRQNELKYSFQECGAMLPSRPLSVARFCWDTTIALANGERNSDHESWRHHWISSRHQRRSTCLPGKETACVNEFSWI